MYRFLAAVTSLALIVAASPVVAADCTGHPAALGTSRVLTVDPMQFHRVGTMQYPETLPLRDHEVVLTFDDGPLSPYTERVLDALQAECVRATFFVVGRMAKAYPSLVRRASSDGHTIASHSQDHRIIGRRLTAAGAKQDYETGVATVATVLGSRNAVAPFYRFPGLGRSAEVEQYLATRGVMVWSADFPADDWKHISANQVTARALARLERKGRGILLLHDIQPATAQALPSMLRELQARHFHIVHVVPAMRAATMRRSEH
jgi:peptidoglycan/xylan/chitin deacetylase (PgdA/CDA1 family)